MKLFGKLRKFNYRKISLINKIIRFEFIELEKKDLGKDVQQSR